MRICIPTLDDAGLDARISDHFGSAPFYTLVDTETGSLDTLANEHHGTSGGHAHGQGGCRALSHVNPDSCDAVAARGMGRGAMASLARSGLKLFVARGDTVSDIVEAARRGDLRQAGDGDLSCGGHHQHGASGCGS
jgi:predicted Fe-Mo cluster-binding NifX family protein